jgi:hypothetical protein
MNPGSVFNEGRVSKEPASNLYYKALGEPTAICLLVPARSAIAAILVILIFELFPGSRHFHPLVFGGEPCRRRDGNRLSGESCLTQNFPLHNV